MTWDQKAAQFTDGFSDHRDNVILPPYKRRNVRTSAVQVLLVSIGTITE